MREIDPGLAAHIAVGVTTLCRCWRIARTDGVVFGVTDHDRPLTFGGIAYDPESGVDASEDVAATGFAVGGMEVAGALSSDRLARDDLAAGVFDNAEIRVYLVNWSAVSERQLLRVGHLGEVTREDGAFRAEIRGLSDQLDAKKGRAFRRTCDADLGDARCGVDLDASSFGGDGTVVAASDRRVFLASGLNGFDEGWFERGRFEWDSGANAGRAAEVRSHRKQSGAVEIELWQPAYHAIEPDDTFTVRAGCDKLFDTCRAKFDNAVNFRGFPHMPGNDFVLTYARSGDDNDGRAVVK